MLPDTVSGQILANLCGVTPDRIRHLATAGVLPRSGRDQYPLTDSIRAYCAYLRRHQGDPASDQLNPQREKALLDRARREQVQLETATRRKQLIPRSDVLDTWSRALAVIRNHLLAVPSKLGGRIGMANAEMVRAEVKQALEELSRFPAEPQ